MYLLHSLLWYAVLVLNVWDGHAALRSASRPSKTRPGRSVADRKREIRANLAMWVVWILYTHLEAIADRTISYVLPFYSEIKMGVLFWMLASRTLGSRFVYTRIVAPTLSVYSTPIDLVLSFVYELTEALRGVVGWPFVWLFNRAKRLLLSISATEATEETKDGTNGQGETTLTPRTVVRRAKVVYEEIERLQRMERPGFRPTGRKQDGGGGGKVRERKWALERQAREREDKELQAEVERLAQAEEMHPRSQDVENHIKKVKGATGQPSRSTTVPGASSPSISVGARSLRPAVAASAGHGPSPLNPTSAQQPLSVAGPVPSSFVMPAAASPFIPRSATPSAPQANAVASGSRPSTPPSRRDVFTAHDTPVNTRSALSHVQPTPVPPGAFHFHKSSTVIPLPVPIIDECSSTLPPSPKPASPARQPPPSKETFESPPKRKVVSPPKLRATPARKAKSKAMLGLTPASRRPAPTIELDERVEDEEGEVGAAKRRRLSLEPTDEGAGEERTETELEEEMEDSGQGRMAVRKDKGKGRARDLGDEGDAEGSVSPKAVIPSTARPSAAIATSSKRLQPTASSTSSTASTSTRRRPPATSVPTPTLVPAAATRQPRPKAVSATPTEPPKAIPVKRTRTAAAGSKDPVEIHRAGTAKPRMRTTSGRSNVSTEERTESAAGARRVRKVDKPA